MNNNVKNIILIVLALHTLILIAFLSINFIKCKVESENIKNRMEEINKKYMEIYKENIILKIKNSIIENNIKDEALQKKIEESLSDISNSIDFFNQSTDTLILQR